VTRLFEGLASRPVITDGAWGTELQLLGLALGECTDAWNLSHPERVESVARAYVEVGSEVILTNTLGANRRQLARHGLGDQVAAINRAGGEISLRAAAGRARVFASVGPAGKLAAMDEVTEAELNDVFSEQVEVLAASGVDALVLETFTDVVEIRAAIVAAKATGLPVVASLVFDSGAKHDRTMTGMTPEQAVAALVEVGADAVGANCGRGIDGYIEVCRRMRATTDVPLWIKPNAGLPDLVDGRAVYRIGATEFAKRTRDLVSVGASFIGGCCGSNPRFIEAIVEVHRT
jgi:5-methyltetrahydrofolate--homocysteine methyltransferase